MLSQSFTYVVSEPMKEVI